MPAERVHKHRSKRHERLTYAHQNLFSTAESMLDGDLLVRLPGLLHFSSVLREKLGDGLVRWARILLRLAANQFIELSLCPSLERMRPHEMSQASTKDCAAHEGEDVLQRRRYGVGRRGNRGRQRRRGTTRLSGEQVSITMTVWNCTWLRCRAARKWSIRRRNHIPRRGCVHGLVEHTFWMRGRRVRHQA